MDLIPVPPWSEALMADFFNRTITESLQYGLTSIHDADTSPARIAFFRKYVWLPYAFVQKFDMGRADWLTLVGSR